MTEPVVLAVIGANFGDEGKGLAVDYFCRRSVNSLVIRHNGGAQAGHTVETDGKRFVFHQLSSGSFRRAATYLAETFLPDLYKLEEETDSFYQAAGFVPKLYADESANITVIDDVLVNMALETSRGENRHGSCGMGINEAVLRSEAGFGVSVGEVIGMTARELSRRLMEIRREYVCSRLGALHLTELGEYGELLHSGTVLENAAEGMLRGAEYLTPVKGPAELTRVRELIVFEGAQGLLLDAENKRFAPHVTASRTGLEYPLMICRKAGLTLQEAVYVMRSYVTRHGAGELPCACEPTALGKIGTDRTNQENPWQGNLRFGYYESPEQLAGAITGDLCDWRGRASLFVTHLNETTGMVKFFGRDLAAERLPEEPSFGGRISGLYCSDSPFSEDTAAYRCEKKI